MPSSTRLALLLCASISITALTACAQQTSQTLPATVAPAQVDALQATSAPPPCKGQKTTKQYASAQEQLKASGGLACIPAFGGFGGDMAYPSLKPSVSLNLIVSTTNYDGMPKLGSGTPILYIQVSISGQTSFGQKLHKGGALVGSGITPGKPYTTFGQASAFGVKRTLPPCYAIAGKSSFGGSLTGLGTLLKGQSVPSAANAVVEIYPGKQTTQKC